MKKNLALKIKLFSLLLLIGFIALLTMFSSYLKMPSSIESSLVKVNVEGMKIGDHKIVKWRDKPIIIIKRDPDDVISLNKINQKFYDPLSSIDTDPKFITKVQRSITPSFFVAINISTYCGCSLKYHKKWEHVKLPGGVLHDPCHTGTYDISGRLLKNTYTKPIGSCKHNKMSNMKIPPYYFESNEVIIIGKNRKHR